MMLSRDIIEPKKKPSASPRKDAVDGTETTRRMRTISSKLLILSMRPALAVPASGKVVISRKHFCFID